MFEKLKFLTVLWGIVVFVYIMMAFTHSTWDSLADTASADMAAGNMTGIYGVEDIVSSSNYWKWIIPGFVGIVGTAIAFREEISERVRG